MHADAAPQSQPSQPWPVNAPPMQPLVSHDQNVSMKCEAWCRQTVPTVWTWSNVYSNSMHGTCHGFAISSPAIGLELYENVLSPDEQSNMIQIIEDWVIQVRASHLPGIILACLHFAAVECDSVVGPAVAWLLAARFTICLMAP